MTYQQFWRSLAPLYGEGEAKAIARLTLQTAFGLTLSDAVCGAVESLPPVEARRLEAMAERLRGGEPVQYVLGEAEFCGRTYAVSPGTLIPRPETEGLCRWAIDTISETKAAKPDILDLCTGSGCIAITLALDIPGASLTAIDIAPEPLRAAKENARRLGASVRIERGDALRLDDDGRRWDLIVSNPPYIRHSERATMHPNVLNHEPELALFVPDDDPLCFHRAIANYARRTLKRGGALLLEINQALPDAVEAMLRAEGFGRAETRPDLFGRPRFALASVERERGSEK